jgi:hypothetical protein
MAVGEGGHLCWSIASPLGSRVTSGGRRRRIGLVGGVGGGRALGIVGASRARGEGAAATYPRDFLEREGQATYYYGIVLVRYSLINIV